MSQSLYHDVESFGWDNNPAEVTRCLQIIEQSQGVPAYFAQAAGPLLDDLDDKTVLFWRAEEKILGGIQKSWNQGGVGSCFPAGTQISLEDGSSRAIETIRLGDRVLTAEGNVGEVTHLFRRHEDRKLVRLHAEATRGHGRFFVHATEEHPILTEQGYVRMDEIRPGRQVRLTKESRWQEITSVIDYPYSGDVYNFEVSGDNSYVANDVGVHNCVSFGYGRAVNDLILLQIANGGMEEWPGATVATEPIYGGSRVEVGGGRLFGDGSVGAWAAEWVRRWGILFRKVYGSIDLSSYSESRCRDWGRRGCPDELEPIAKERPVQTTSLVQSADQAWVALGNGYPISVCSNQGFDSPLVDGFCEPRGSWAHCMCFRGRLMAMYRGRLVKAFVIQNSWGNYIRGDPFVVDKDNNRIQLPEGCFCAAYDVVDAMCRQRDTFALSGFKGFPRQQLDWIF